MNEKPKRCLTIALTDTQRRLIKIAAAKADLPITKWAAQIIIEASRKGLLLKKIAAHYSIPEDELTPQQIAKFQ
jgi:hypothetical protein